MAIKLNTIKSEQYLGIIHSNWDTEIKELAVDVIARAIDYLDNDIYTTALSLDSAIESALCKQITFEFQRRKSLGLKSIFHDDGRLEKYEDDEWLKSVKRVLDRKMSIAL